MPKISTGAYRTPVGMPQVAYMHHWGCIQMPEVHFLIPVAPFFARSGCPICTTPTLPPTTAFQAETKGVSNIALRPLPKRK